MAAESAPAVAGNESPIADGIVERAMGWYVLLASGEVSAAERADFERWLAVDPEHGRAWRRLQGIGGRLQGSVVHVEPPVARSTLARANALVLSRRRALKLLALTGTGGAALYLSQPLSWRYELSAALADQRTASGERRRLVLPDGTLLELNTATAVDIRFDEQQRGVVLHGGEILVATAHDPLGRPFTVVTPEGRLVPIGTRFVVRRDEAPTRAAGVTRLAVTEGMVQIHPADGVGAAPVLIKASEQAYFNRHQVTAVQSLREAGLAWTEGVLVAEGMPLGDFVAELSRYHRGHLRCEAEVAHLRITGTWPLVADSPSEAILASLERQLPVRVRRFTRYWVTVAAR